MIRRKYVVLSLLTLVSVVLGGLIYSSLVQAQATVTGYVSVPAAAFVPWLNTKDWRVSGIELLNYENRSWAVFVADVQLPHGATVTNFTTHWYDIGTNRTECRLLKYAQHGYGILMAEAHSPISGAPGWSSSYDDTILYPTVDNTETGYLMKVLIPNSTSPHWDYRFHFAVIEYTLPSEAAVGGLYIPVDKLSLLAPYIALVSTIILAVSMSVAYIKIRKKQ